MLDEFKKFIMRGNVLDLAVGVVIGAAFGKIVSSFTEDLLMPPIGLALGKVDFSNLFINLSSTPVASVADAKKAGIATINYGLFLNNLINFLIIAFCVFLLVKAASKLAPKPAAATPEVTTKECKFCCSTIALAATRCPQCTSELNAA